jgi:hypothetical protein
VKTLLCQDDQMQDGVSLIGFSHEIIQ